MALHRTLPQPSQASQAPAHRWRALLPVALGVAVAMAATAVPRAAWACASCSAGDPTITPLGLEARGRGQLRVATEAKVRGQRHDGVRVEEHRLELSASWTPLRQLTLALLVPVVRKSATSVAGTERLARPGDVGVWARWSLWQSARYSPTHHVYVVAGADAPTGSHQATVDGRVVSEDAQTGNGAWDVSAGLSYVLSPGGDWAGFGSVIVTQGLSSHHGSAETLVRGSVAAQWQAVPEVGLRGVADFRYEEDGATLLAGADLFTSIDGRVLLTVGVRAPVASQVGEDVNLAASLAVDF